MKLTPIQIQKLEEHLSSYFNEPIEFHTIDEHPNKEVKDVMIWYKTNHPNALYQYIIAHLTVGVNNDLVVEKLWR